MMKKLLPAILILAIVAVLFIISSRRKVPQIPADSLHQNITSNEVCTGCHSPGKQAPLKANHPPKEQCLLCHKYK